jgi:hypothetical protein
VVIKESDIGGGAGELERYDEETTSKKGFLIRKGSRLHDQKKMTKAGQSGLQQQEKTLSDGHGEEWTAVD